MQDFLNPKSMVTPGAAGATMMFLVNGLSVPFPELPARYAALALSLVIGAIAFKAVKLTMVERGIYWVLNSLVIFVVGFGANSLGREAGANPAAPNASASAPIFASLISSAYAQNGQQPSPAAKVAPTKSTTKGASTQSAEEAAKLKAELEALRRENEVLRQQSDAQKQPPAAAAVPPKKEESFFRKW